MIVPPCGSRYLTSAVHGVPSAVHVSPSTTACSEGSVNLEVALGMPIDEELCQEATSVPSTRSCNSTGVASLSAIMREMLAKTSAVEPSFLSVESRGTTKSSVIGVSSATQPVSSSAALFEESNASFQLAEVISLVSEAIAVSCRMRTPESEGIGPLEGIGAKVVWTLLKSPKAPQTLGSTVYCEDGAPLLHSRCAQSDVEAPL